MAGQYMLMCPLFGKNGLNRERKRMRVIHVGDIIHCPNPMQPGTVYELYERAGKPDYPQNEDLADRQLLYIKCGGSLSGEYLAPLGLTGRGLISNVGYEMAQHEVYGDNPSDYAMYLKRATPEQIKARNEQFRVALDKHGRDRAAQGKFLANWVRQHIHAYMNVLNAAMNEGKHLCPDAIGAAFMDDMDCYETLWDEFINSRMGKSLYNLSADNGMTWTKQWLSPEEAEKEVRVHGHICNLIKN